MPEVLFLVAGRTSIKISSARTAGEAQGAETVYLFTPADSADEAATERFAGLLDARISQRPQAGWLILPRPGMISPWSSKACAIAASCGMEPPLLLERAFWHRDAQPQCDRMLETTVSCTALDEWLAAGSDGNDPGKEDPDADLESLARSLQLQLDAAELARLEELYRRLDRNPSATELLLMAQTNSEHCRHKTFRAQVEGFEDPTPLFSSIRSTHERSPAGTLVAYRDNAAIIELGLPRAFAAEADGYWRQPAKGEPVHTVIKAETHNHPTGISPFPGAATGAGGEIRDEAAAGRGAASHAGLAGYMTSDLRIPGFEQPWEKGRQGFPARQATPLQIIVDAPLGAAAFGNEFGRPTLAGFFRTLELQAHGECFGYHKPVMIAGGMGEIGQDAVAKRKLQKGDLIVQLGGPGLRVGMSGGAASSNSASQELDYASVQRDNAQMQRRAQEAIDCCRLADHNPLKAIHDVGAGGIGNAVAELSDPLGCEVDLESVPTGQHGLTDAEIWCNESQERYVAAVDPADLAQLEGICQRTSCPLAAIGLIADHARIRVQSASGLAVDLPCRDLFGGDDLPALVAVPPPPRQPEGGSASADAIDLAEAARRVLRAPAVADKSFLITIADRTVGGLTARDQLVGPWQTAVADCAVTFVDHFNPQGRAMAIGERPAVAIDNPGASVRLAIAEALTNLCAADLVDARRTKLSLNWMAACDGPQPAGELVAAVRAATDGFLPELGISVPVGKDSLSMRVRWREDGREHDVRSPLTCVASAFCTVNDAAATLTPQLCPDPDCLLLLLRAGSSTRLGGSILNQVFGRRDPETPDVQASQLRGLLDCLAGLKQERLIVSYHDLGDGGLFATVAEMAFAGNCGVTLALDALCQPQMGQDADGCETSSDATAPGGIGRIAAELFCEEIGAVIQVRRADAPRVLAIAAKSGLDSSWPQTVGWPNDSRRLVVLRNEKALVDLPIDELRSHWSALGAQIRARRDDPHCAAEEESRCLAEDTGLFASGDPAVTDRPPATAAGGPEAAVLCEQGTNGHLEMAAALFKAGFAVRIIFMSELAAKPELLDCVRMLALPGGFSYGDTLGAGRGQAQVILSNRCLRQALRALFERDSLTLGVCNGCQVLSQLGEMLPDAGRCRLPRFAPNRSRRFEGRLCMVEVMPGPSPLLAPLAGMKLPVPVSSGEGRPVFEPDADLPAATAALRYVDHSGQPAEKHPFNPSGADGGLCGFATPDGKVTMLMPHPERAVRAGQLSWNPSHWRERTPWQSMFDAAADHLRGENRRP